MVEKNDEKPFNTPEEGDLLYGEVVKIKRLTPEEIEEQEEFYEKRENRENRDIFLKLKYKSWINFFRVWYMKREPIELADGSGLGNYSTLITVLEGQFREKTGFDESFYDLQESDDPIVKEAIQELKSFKKRRDMKKKLKKERIYPEIDCPKCKKSIKIEPFLEIISYFEDCIEIDCPSCEHYFSIKCTYETIERMWEVDET